MHNNRKTLSYVQISRAVAILFVLIGHVNTEFYALNGYDWFDLGEWERTGGVDFFFIVTGFMIYYLYHKHIGNPIKAREFLLKRAIRILPLYWIFTLVLGIIAYFVPVLGEHYSGTDIVKSLFFLVNEPVLGSAWSLKHILFFYILFAALIYLPRFIKPIIIVWIIATILFELKILQFHDSFLFSFSSLEVLMGSVVAYAILHYNIRFSSLWLTLGWLGFLMVWMNNIYSHYAIHAPLFYCLFSMLIMLGIAEKDKNPRKVPKLLSFLGDASYSIYIAHGPLLMLYITILESTRTILPMNHSVMMILVILLTTGSCCMVYLYIEKPITSALRQRLLHPKDVKYITAKLSSDAGVTD
jgi:exopolysaccharide production protein ExoZ